MDTHSLSLISTLLLVFSAAIFGGATAKLVKQPLLLGYIAAGVLFGNVFPAITDQSFLKIIAETGVTLLLFTLGVEFSFHRLKRLMSTIGWAAVFQILLCIFVFLLLTMFLGFAFLPALIIAVAASLSSTAVVVKVLSERGELDTIPGEVMTAWLVIQDLAVIPIMILLPAVVSATTTGDISLVGLMSSLGVSIVKAAIAIGIIIFMGRRLVPQVLGKVAGMGSREIFMLVTVGLVFLSAVTTYTLGLSAALGAFVAGLLIAETSQNHAIFAEVRPLRDLFAVVFFVSIGMGIPVHYLWRSAGLLAILTLAILLFKWFVVMGLMRFLGYHRKTSFLVAVGLTQMSEFGFIIAAQSVALGAIGGEHATLLIAVTFLTILISAPLIARGHGLYYAFHEWLGKYTPMLFHTKKELADMKEELPFRDHVVLCGYGRVGKYIGRALEMAGLPFVVVDYNNATIAKLKEKGIPVVYGDPADKDVLDFAQVDLAKALIIAIPDRHTQEMVIGHAQTLNRRIKIICRTHHEEDQKHLKSLGVDAVVQPEFEAAISIVERLLPTFGVPQDEIAGKISRLKIEHGAG
ncbi:MAG: Sodium/hydrogen exchanger [Candidatus Gottesmanbacteria bacterium GW2011_GWB1_49_7]|uniref:Sodium/hydrogen exchanger n=1 Tax=Candidatus Gottesmanbacteria bacterium GW2011_GWB1_49_7 TaxID=1618448 RepID=A0A0G1Y9N7_9BACT|nr:MAG: Sodium/hydrogen exchanger [Candidatus Gottesmanbacteria bacterium GW2011_GWB1_49_7]